ncbi:MAG: protein kinase [candidate division KSB1 bacterium]|nr:protein kinase [candidate division KSB1 bacterium]
MMSEVLFEKFELLECLKKDQAMGVYAAHHRYLGKRILLKTLDRRHADAAALERFQREARSLAKLEHPNVIRVLDFGSQGDQFYISFEYFESCNLRQLMSGRPLTSAEKLHILKQLAAGLAAAHRFGIIHRDLKPENILVNDNLQVKIADFGLAVISGEPTLTHPSSIVGTPGYMSPEQILGRPLTPQSDLFSLGIIVCELFIGANPFLGEDIGTTLNRILSLSVDCSQAPPEISPILSKLLAKNPSERLDSAETLLRLLGNTVEAPKKRRRIPILIPIIAAAAAGIAVLLFSSRSPSLNESKPLPAAAADSDQGDSLQPPQIQRVEEAEPERQKVREQKAVESASGSLMIRCLPWAEVWLDGRLIDTTPLSEALVLPTGEHLLELKHPNYPTFTQTVRISPRKMQTVAVNLDTLVARLQCQVYPWGEVYLDNQFIGVTPFKDLIIIPAGEHWLRIENPQFGRHEERIIAACGETLYVHFAFDEQNRKSAP